jgi:hypothetical protein
MQLIYEANWSTYEEWGAVRVFEQDEQLYIQYGGRSVYSELRDPDWEEPYLSSYEEVLELIDDWDGIKKEYENYFDGSFC